MQERFARLGTFTLKDPSGYELSYTPSGKPRSDELGEDFTDLLLALGEAASDRGRGIVFLLDEVQFVAPDEFGPFVVGLHRLNQKALPVTCVAAGLPSLPALAGEAKSYAKRLFEYPRIDRLSKADALEALREPADRRHVAWEEKALEYVFRETGGYPYFLKQYGKYIWDVAEDHEISLVAARAGKKGLIYAPRHGTVDYTVPGFVDYLRRRVAE